MLEVVQKQVGEEAEVGCEKCWGVVGGGGGGIGKCVSWVALIVAKFSGPGAGFFGAGCGVVGPLPTATMGTLTTIGTVTSAIGAALILSGTAQLLSPQPADLPGLTSFGGGGRHDSFHPSQNDTADNRSSTINHGTYHLTTKDHTSPL